MLAILEDISESVASAFVSAWKQAETDSITRLEIESSTFIEATGLLKDCGELGRNQDGGADVSLTFIADRVYDDGTKDAEVGSYRMVRVLANRPDARRGEIVEMPTADAEWLIRIKEVAPVTEAEAAKWHDAVERGPFVPDLGDNLRIASMLHKGG